ncbi:MAG TPA: hypothetical protein VFQ44_08430 [Streptosporangiaceae bacterium]|nr:hypothetical protein [Streptosporangiaceae bacterium]
MTLSLRDLTGEVLRLSREDTARLTRKLRKNPNSPAAAVAQAVRTTLAKRGEDEVCQTLHDALHYGVLATKSTVELRARELAALLIAEPARLSFLADYALRDILASGVDEFGISAPSRAAAWSSMICTGHDGAVAALGWLIADPPEFWSDSQREAVTDVWAQVRYRLPELPERPASLTKLCDVVAGLERTGTLEVMATGAATTAQASDHADPDAGSISAAQAETLMARLKDFQARYRDVRGSALADVDTAMAAGQVPPIAALHELESLAIEMESLLQLAAEVTMATAFDTLDMALEELEAFSATQATVLALDRVRRLTGLRAPEYVAVEAALIADLAARADTETDPATLAALEALVMAIDLGGTDPQQSTELVRVVQTSMPSAAVLVMLASNGVLSIDDADEPPAPVPAGPEPAEATNDNPVLETSPDPGQAPATDQATGPQHGHVPDATVVEPSIDEILAGLDLDLPIGTTEAADSSDGPGSPAAGGDHAESGTDTAEDSHDQAVDVDKLYASLMDSRQYALAARLDKVTGATPVTVTSHYLAAHALAMRTSTGPNVAAFKDLVATIDADALRNLPGEQMLVYAASVRAGLLSPTAGAADPLRDMCPAVVRCGPGIRELTDALLACIYSGAHLTPRGSDAVAEVATLEAAYADQVAAARAMLEAAFSRNIRYVAATELFKTWMAPHGYLGAALTMVASGSRRGEDIKFVRDRVTDLRSRSQLESAIDRDTRTQAHGRRPRRMEARAREKVIERATYVADTLAAWVETTEAITQSSNTGWMSRQIAELRNRVTASRAAAVSELAPLTAAGATARSATVRAGLALLENSLDLLTAGIQLESDSELPADQVANGLLALAPDLPLDIEPALAPRRAVTVADIAAVAAAIAGATAGWSAAFSQRAERADHVGTAILIEMLRGHDPALARRLSAIRDRDAADAADILDEQVAKIAAQIDSDRRFGRVDADTWAQLSIRTRALGAERRRSRRDFDVMKSELAIIWEDRAKAVAETVVLKWQQLAELHKEAALTDDQAARISNCIADEDITTADEYIETIRSRGQLPAPRSDADHLARFFPAFPALFTAPTKGLSAFTELKRAIDSGQNPKSGGLADVLGGAGIDLAQIARQPTAASRLEQWKNLVVARPLDGRLSQVKPVLEQLGFLVTNADTPHHRKGQVPGVSSWIHLTGVRGTEGEALIPAFGSKISPTGDTLRVLAVWKSPTPGRLVELLRDEPADHSVLVLYFGTLGVDARRELATMLRSGPRLPTTIVVDAAAFAYLVAQPTPRRDTTMATLLPFASSAPFTPDVAGLVPVEMFHGRTDELDQVIDMMGSCIVYGGRQLGKSALLRAAARKFNEGEHRQAIYQSIYKVGQGSIPASKVWAELWPRLAEKGIAPDEISSGDITASAIGHITSWVTAVPGRQLLLLLDESDFFLDADAKEGKFPHVAAFRDLMEHTDRAVKVVFAGLHKTARFERLANHPLAHFGNPVCVGPLTPQHAYDLLTDPLRALGFRFDDDNVAARVLALANNQPSLIQLFGAKLLSHLHRRGVRTNLPQIVTADDIETVWSDESLRDNFRKRFDWTLNLDPRYKIIAYAVADHTHVHGFGSALTATALRSQCEQWWPQGFAAEDVRTSEFRALLDECVALGVLSYGAAEGAYRLRTPNVLALLGSRDEVEDVLDAAESTRPPESFDGSLLRPPYAGGITRGPLTSAQIADLLATRNQVRVIAGTEALTIPRCARVLRDENSRAVYGARSISIKETNAANFEMTCQSAAMVPGHSVVVTDLRAASRMVATEIWDKAREAIAARVGGTIGIVLITDATQASLWVRVAAKADASSNLTALQRYDNTGLRLWLNETTIPFQDDASRARLLTLTGGWPVLLNRVAETSTSEQDSDMRSDALDDLRNWLAEPANARDFLDKLGVRTDAVLSAAWDFLVTELSGDAADAQTLAELLALSAADDRYAALEANRITALGYGGTEALVDIFRILGVLIVDASDGQLRLEAIAAAAAACAGQSAASG